MPFTPEPNQPDFNQLEVSLVNSKIQIQNNALYQTIKGLIREVKKFQGITVDDIKKIKNEIAEINVDVTNVSNVTDNSINAKSPIPLLWNDDVDEVFVYPPAPPSSGSGSVGPPGANGANGLNGLPGIDGEDGLDSFIPGPAGLQGAQGINGSIGKDGVPGLDGLDGEDSWVMGPQGRVGPTGLDGPRGLPGTDGEDGLDSYIPGPPGIAGSIGATGPAGIKGDPGIPGLDAEEPEYPYLIPGPRGATGASGGGGGGSATIVEVDLGTGSWMGKFVITDAAIDATKKVIISQAPGPYTGKGTLADEAQMDPIVCFAEPLAGSANVYWQTLPIISVTPYGLSGGDGGKSDSTLPTSGRRSELDIVGVKRLGKVKGNVKFQYMVMS